MDTDNIHYVNVKPYTHILNFDVMLHRFLLSNIGQELLEDNEVSYFTKYMKTYIKKYKFDVIKKNNEDYEIDKILGKQIFLLLNDFFTI
jgi:hypothetical protein